MQENNAPMTVSSPFLRILILVPLLLPVLLFLLVRSEQFADNQNTLALGITLDLVITIPILYYILIRYQPKIPNITVIPFTFVVLFLAELILPVTHQELLFQLRHWIIPILEVTALVFIGQALVRIRKQTKEHTSTDFFTALIQGTAEVIPGKAGKFFATEIAVFYYGFFAWNNKKFSEAGFSVHKNGAGNIILIILIFLTLTEAAILHILLSKWSTAIAWILTLISIYAGLQMFGMLRSISKRPVIIENNSLHLRYGILNQASTQITNITSAEIFSGNVDDTHAWFSMIGGLTNDHNIRLEFKEPVEVEGLYGMKKQSTLLYLHVDEPERFISRIYQTGLSDRSNFSYLPE